jgi:ribonuclease HIII
MSNVRLDSLFNEIKKKLRSNAIEVSNYQDIAYGLQFTVSQNEKSGLMRVYMNKKGQIKYDYSQTKEPLFAQIIQKLLEGQPNVRKSSETASADLGFPIIGTDESGKGDYFGPLVSAGVYVDANSAILLQHEGVRDSKKLSDARNIELAHKIMIICKDKFSLIEISPEKYNDLYDQFTKENKNLNSLLAWGHARAIEEVLSKVDCKIAIADKFADERFIQSKLQERGRQLTLIQIHKGEQNIAVAAASILARARFIEKLSKLSLEYKVEFPKGASAAVINIARKLVKDCGRECLYKVAKLHFKTTQEVFSNT